MEITHTFPPEDLRKCVDGLPRSGLPNRWIPQPSAFFHIPSLPYLGTGKLDLQSIRELACDLSKEVQDADTR